MLRPPSAGTCCTPARSRASLIITRSLRASRGRSSPRRTMCGPSRSKSAPGRPVACSSWAPTASAAGSQQYMAFDFKLPDLGENVESGDIVNVLVKEGDEIQPEQNVFEVETGKAVVELPCPQGGKISKIHVQKGSKVKVGDSLLSLE